MATESDDAEARRWLVEPPGPQDVSFQIAAGDQVEITPEIRRAFDDLVEALGGGGDVEGFTASDCTGYIKGCTTNEFSCQPRRKCLGEHQAPCFVDYHCYIQQIG
jgi:hypothetical protein